MKLIELHILQSFPVSCLNRDDVGAPKTAVFGGVNRARISSQSLKRAIRMAARDGETGEAFQGVRSRLLKQPFIEALTKHGLADEKKATVKADEILAVFSKQDSKKPDQVTTAVFLSPGEIDSIAKAVVEGRKPQDAAKKAVRNDAADIALFGRMVANDATLNVEGAAMFSHALSVHRADNDLDFFSAVDDRKTDAEDAGAGMIGTLEFTSALYYRYCAVNLGLLADDHHLAGLSPEQRQATLDAFIRAVLTAVPGARKNSMNAHTFPSFVLGVAKDKGQPVQLINAFEEPLSNWDTKQRGGWEKTAIERLKAHHESLKKTWNVETTAEVSIPESDLNTFCQTLSRHVD
ncbi:MAG TPA: type I-E CRISPR-associated protein Cas7/Cse4/CasC [Methylomirabilota bacterium]|nr:type I-E CRISPR-associated protein Cas7/Cse4/CasC [Methylomirabilota bacterium]